MEVKKQADKILYKRRQKYLDEEFAILRSTSEPALMIRHGCPVASTFWLDKRRLNQPPDNKHHPKPAGNHPSSGE